MPGPLGSTCGQCTTDADCAGGDVCGLVSTAEAHLGLWSACLPPASTATGLACVRDQQCASGTCAGGFCSTCRDDSTCGGGALANFGTVTVRQCILSGNTANAGGGGAILNANAGVIRDYLPDAKLKPRARAWLERAFPAGRVPRGQVLFRGRPADFPFRQDEGYCHVLLWVEGMALTVAVGLLAGAAQTFPHPHGQRILIRQKNRRSVGTGWSSSLARARTGGRSPRVLTSWPVMPRIKGR